MRLDPSQQSVAAIRLRGGGVALGYASDISTPTSRSSRTRKERKGKDRKKKKGGAADVSDVAESPMGYGGADDDASPGEFDFIPTLDETYEESPKKRKKKSKSARAAVEEGAAVADDGAGVAADEDGADAGDAHEAPVTAPTKKSKKSKSAPAAEVEAPAETLREVSPRRSRKKKKVRVDDVPMVDPSAYDHLDAGLIDLGEFGFNMEGVDDLPTTEEELRVRFLDMHNFFRQQFGLEPLTWSTECEALAAEQAETCMTEGFMFHGNYTTEDGEVHGQNIAQAVNNFVTPEKATIFWMRELDLFDVSMTEDERFEHCGHMAQVLWSETREVGFAISADGKFAVANYYPAGNQETRWDECVPVQG